MQPVQITIHDLPSSPALEDHIRKKVDKLTQFYNRINSCRIVVTIPQKHKHHGKQYCVRIDLMVPGKELVANRRLNEDVYIAIREAFCAVQRQLDNYARKRRGEVKTHEMGTRGSIKRLFSDDGYGFIEGMDGDELYFSSANMSNSDFFHLKIGDNVEYISLMGADGLQAHRVSKIKQNHLIEKTV